MPLHFRYRVRNEWLCRFICHWSAAPCWMVPIASNRPCIASVCRRDLANPRPGGRARPIKITASGPSPEQLVCGPSSQSIRRQPASADPPSAIQSNPLHGIGCLKFDGSQSKTNLSTLSCQQKWMIVTRKNASPIDGTGLIK